MGNEVININKKILNQALENQRLRVWGPFQRFKSASGKILDEGRHTDEEETNQLNKKEDE